MSQYFQVKVQFVNEDNKKQSVAYLVDAMSVTEAEARITDYLSVHFYFIKKICYYLF